MMNRIPLLLLPILSILSPGWAAGHVSVADLRCEYLENPRGIETPAPRFSWKLISDERDVVQVAWRIEAASSPEKLAAGTPDLWDSGRVESDQSHLVPYGGAGLSSRQIVWWRVTVWTRPDAEPCVSEPAFWEVGLLEPADWKAEWIGAGDVPPVQDRLVEDWCEDVVYQPTSDSGYERERRLDERAIAQRPDRIARVKAAQPAVWLRRMFDVSQPVTRARLYSSALGYYEIYLDGEKISDRVLDPGQTNYEKRVLYNIDDITDRLAPGRHELRILLAEGWYGQSHGFFNPKFRYGNPLAIAQLDLEYAEGGQDVIATDASWTFAASAIAKANLYSGEVVDGRIGEDDLVWQPVVGPAPGQPLPERMAAQLFPPTRKVRTLHPVSVIESRPGVWVFDMGKNFTGWVRLRVEAPRGTAVDLKFGELLTPAMEIDWDTQGRRAVGVYQHDRFICGGGGVEYFEPRFTFHGFRYVEVTGLPSAPKADDVVGYLVRTDVPVVGNFSCSDPLMNRLHETIVHTYECNLIALPSDCPTREKCGWLDCHLTQAMTYYNFDMFQFWEKYAADIRDSSDLHDGLPTSIVPGRRTGIPAFDWGIATVFIPWRQYLYTGDRRILEAQWPYMVRYMEHGREISRNWIIHHALGDWCDQPSTIELAMTRVDGSPFNSLPATTATMHFFHAAKCMAAIARVLGHEADAARFDEWSEAIRQAINEVYFHRRGNTYNSQTGNALAIAYGIPDPETIPVVARVLADEIRYGNAGHFNVGSHGATHLYHALTDYGHADVAREIFAKTDYPSYGYMFSLGATSIWENMSRFDPVKMTTQKSLSHPFQGGFDHWFFEAVAGLRIDPREPAFKRLMLRPELVGLLSHAEATLETPYGTASSSWRVTGERFEWEVRIPPNTQATLVFPEGVRDIRLDGSPWTTAPARLGGHEVANTARLGSGSYHLQATLPGTERR